jgi:hypothetical protein
VPRTPQEIEAALRDRAIAESEENLAYPGEPTLQGWLRAMKDEVVALRLAAEEQEEKQASS